MIRTRRHRRPIAEINVVPYIDVMLVLLVIFMITTPLITQGVHVDLPQANADTLSQNVVSPLIISVNKTGELYLNFGEHQERPIDDEGLMLQIAGALARDHNATVMVKGDSQVDYGRVVHAMVLAQAAGAASVGLITEPLEKQ